MTVFRVAFGGPDFEVAAIHALTETGVTWEGSFCHPTGLCDHTALVVANSDEEAIALAQRSVSQYGAYDNFQATVVQNSKGEPWQVPFYRAWHEIDWQTPERATLTEFERTLLWALTNDHEPVWTIVKDPDVHANRVEIEAALAQLERKSLIDKRIAASGEPGHETELVPWWAITHEGWDLLGMIPSPRYR